ncbi:MAG: ImmA/IrrE family metallo-endopeptidase [Prochloron sp. SP5CPC1]|nr:ImmA/IrrE family metallo-endopeptidase [Candidatus Paraprochloron terpiosi SP5CPC1]
MKKTIAENLIRYRKGLSLSQEQLAEEVGVTRQNINDFENAKTLPDSKTLSALARALGVTLDDLLRADKETIPNFRFRAHASHKQKPQFVAQVRRLLETYNALEQVVGLSPYTPESTPCHEVKGNEERIADIATQFRHRLGMGDGPIFNLFEATEKIGLKVLRQPIPMKNFFGLSAYSANQGAFVLVHSHNITIERQLFTLAHEIGHLIFHRDEYEDTLINIGTKEEEKAREKVADYFASHLLVPQDALERALNDIKALSPLKAHFRVSYQMILMRLEEMGGLKYSDSIKQIRWQYKQSTGKSLTNDIEIEPCLSESEFPENQRFKTLVWQSFKIGKISELKAAELLNLKVEELEKRRQEREVYAIA